MSSRTFSWIIFGMFKGMDSEVESCFEVSDVPFFLFLGSGAFVFASTFLAPVAGEEVAF
jgi:hypothetical protein